MERIFEIVEKHSQSATFFCMAWIAKKYPKVVREIVERGYEIGSHSYMHQLVYEQTKDDFEKDLDYSVKLLEDVSGKKVKYFRAPGFSITENQKWAFEILAELGIEIDSSVFPTSRGHGGFPSYREALPSIIKYNGVELKELPINTFSAYGKHLIFSGGGYFRLLPYNLIKKMSNSSDYIMTYFHPRDFDNEQPIIKELPLSRKFKSYYGLKTAQSKFERWMVDYPFVDIKTANETIDWNKVSVINL